MSLMYTDCGHPKWHSCLWHCITMLAVQLEILGSSPGSVAASHDREAQRLLGLGEGLAGKDVLVPSCTRDTCGRPGTVNADMVDDTVFPLTHWCGWLPG
jgi:hypothetical protein